MINKAKFLGISDDVTCILCFLLKSQNPKVQYHLVDEGTFYRPEDKFVCEHCLKWIRDVRSTCENQCIDPENYKFGGLTFWHDPKKQDKSAIEVVGSKSNLED